MLCSFLSEVNLTRCDRLFHGPYPSTYHNESLNHESNIDFFASNPEAVLLFSALDLNINLSDHRPICVMCSFVFDHEVNIDDAKVVQSSSTNYVSELRWDKADLKLYREVTEYYLQPIYSELLELEHRESITANAIDYLYNRIVAILTLGADTAVPKCKKDFFEFWWDSDIDELKEKSIASCKLWKDAGKPRSGSIFTIYRRDKAM